MENKVAAHTIPQHVIKQVCLNVVFNVILNAFITWSVLRAYTTIPFSGGEDNLVKCILPMYFILPFLLTLVVLAQTKDLAKKGKLIIDIPEANAGNWFLLRLSLLNGLIAFIPATLVCMVVAHYSSEMVFSTLSVVLISGLSAGVLAGFFTIQAIVRLQK